MTLNRSEGWAEWRRRKDDDHDDPDVAGLATPAEILLLPPLKRNFVSKFLGPPLLSLSLSLFLSLSLSLSLTLHLPLSVSHLDPFSGYSMTFVVVSSEAGIADPGHWPPVITTETLHLLSVLPVHSDRQQKEGKEMLEGRRQSNRRDRKWQMWSMGERKKWKEKM